MQPRSDGQGAATTGVDSTRAAGGDPHCLAVMYHYVHDAPVRLNPACPSAPSGVHALTSAEFAAQLDLLCRDREPIDWPTLYAWTQGRGTIPRRSFLLTFDDGLSDHVNTVLPILEDRRLRGVFFAPGAVLASHTMLPAHSIHLLLSTFDDETFERELSEVLTKLSAGADWAASVDLGEAERMYHYETPTRARLKYLLTIALPIDVRNRALHILFDKHIGAEPRWSRRWYLGWHDLVAMQAQGHTIGAHGFCHEPYTRLSPRERRIDLRKVSDLLASGLGVDLRPLAYPYGSFDDDVATACAKAGFAHAFTTQRSFVSVGCDSFAIPRIDTIHVEAELRDEVACAR